MEGPSGRSARGANDAENLADRAVRVAFGKVFVPRLHRHFAAVTGNALGGLAFCEGREDGSDRV